LPRLYELLGGAGADLQYFEEDGQATTDGRGYIELMSSLFPPAGGVTWRSPDYPRAVAESASSGAYEGLRPPTRVHVWEPVIRQVVLALCALEDTGQPGANLQLRLETVARLTGSWVNVLGHLVGQESPRLPGPIR
jgi:hypothetical protein